jgi:hypothetical protein
VPSGLGLTFMLMESSGPGVYWWALIISPPWRHSMPYHSPPRRAAYCGQVSCGGRRAPSGWAPLALRHRPPPPPWADRSMAGRREVKSGEAGREGESASLGSQRSHLEKAARRAAWRQPRPMRGRASGRGRGGDRRPMGGRAGGRAGGRRGGGTSGALPAPAASYHHTGSPFFPAGTIHPPVPRPPWHPPSAAAGRLQPLDHYQLPLTS